MEAPWSHVRIPSLELRWLMVLKQFDYSEPDQHKNYFALSDRHQVGSNYRGWASLAFGLGRWPTWATQPKLLQAPVSEPGFLKLACVRSKKQFSVQFLRADYPCIRLIFNKQTVFPYLQGSTRDFLNSVANWSRYFFEQHVVLLKNGFRSMCKTTLGVNTKHTKEADTNICAQLLEFPVFFKYR